MRRYRLGECDPPTRRSDAAWLIDPPSHCRGQRFGSRQLYQRRIITTETSLIPRSNAVAMRAMVLNRKLRKPRLGHWYEPRALVTEAVEVRRVRALSSVSRQATNKG